MGLGHKMKIKTKYCQESEKDIFSKGSIKYEKSSHIYK